MGIVTNPFLPLNTYIPDGEPHVFDGRVYLFGSHDREAGDSFCLEDYVFWSAPVDDLSDWSNRGPSYSPKQDPLYDEHDRCSLYAPDVVRGNDGKYYLYYCLSGYRGAGGYKSPISVAKCDTPDGRYEYLGVVSTKDGKPYLDRVCFDPALINDDGVIRLYYGTCYPLEDDLMLNGHRVDPDDVLSRFNPGAKMGAVTVTLEDDMLTIREEAKTVIPTATMDTSFRGHAFFEGSSIRRINGTYYFIYSSVLNHELCYATSAHPDRDFVFGGTIVSAGDIGINGRKEKDRLNHTGTTHGSVEMINGQWYVFYHRLTHGSGYSRQACAEKIVIREDGSIPQVEITSCGLNDGPLPCDHTFSAAIACVVTDGHMEHGGNGFAKEKHPVITNEKTEYRIEEITDGTLIGFRSFAVPPCAALTIEEKGEGEGDYEVRYDLEGSVQAIIHAEASEDNHILSVRLPEGGGTLPVYLRYCGTGRRMLVSVRIETHSGE